MSLYLITGLPRQGKSYFSCRKIYSGLRYTEQNVYTNLPLNPDYLCRFVALRKSKKAWEYNDLLPRVVERLHMFHKFNNFKELREFRKKNPMFCQTHCNRDRKHDFTLNSGQLLYDIIYVLDFWEWSKSNSLHFYDEVYQFWDKADSSDRSVGAKERRKRLKLYSRQHGHYDDDLYLISHDIKDVDTFIISCCQYVFDVTNSKDTTVIPAFLLEKYKYLFIFRGLKYLFQFFIVQGYIGKNREPDKCFHIWPEKDIFKCYNSKASAVGLGKEMVKDAKSSNYKRSFWKELLEWFKSAWISLLFLLLFGIGIHAMYKGFRKILDSHKKPQKKSSVIVEENKTKKSGQGVETSTTAIEKEPLKIVFLSDNKIKFDNGLVIKRGLKYEYKNIVFNVVSVGREFCKFSYQGKDYKIKTSSIR